jgi:site-specific DNA-methyltransferase (adenine-specific)
MIDETNIELLHGDCLELMKGIPDNSIDLVLCDLPYGTTACAWDAVIPFEPLWEQYKRVTKDNSPIVLFSTQPFTTMLIYSNIKWFREEIIWLKNRGGSGLHSDKRHIKTHENIVVFAKGSYTFNPQKWEVGDKKFLVHRKVFDYGYAKNNIYGNIRDIKKPDDGTRNPISVVSYEVPFSPSKSREYDSSVDIRYHPTQKPVALLEYLIRTYSNDGNIVLDNTMGCGSTGVACANTGRGFIGIEMDSGYCDIAEKRINEALKHKTKTLF